MARRERYTEVQRVDFVTQPHVKGMGDIAFKVFQCPNGSCTAWFTVRVDDIIDAFDLPCGECNYVVSSGEVVKIYSYKIFDKRIHQVVDTGDFEILIDDYVTEAPEYKYCIICSNLKPLDAFGAHSARRTKRQGECRQCKNIYNSLKNQTRTTDQHREAAQKRRLYVDLGGHGRIDTARISQKFNGCCFQCGLPVNPTTANIDHTLPIYYLWPLETETATLLCQTHNGEKSNKWPSAYYTDEQLRRLSILTGISYDLLRGNPEFNPAALERLKNASFISEMMVKYAGYPTELYNLRNRVLGATNVDFFAYVPEIAFDWIAQADIRRR